jgi:tRNA(Ile)-lysidine synthase
VVLLALYRIFGPHMRWSRSHVRAILKLADSHHPSKVLHMPGRLTVTREQDRLRFAAADREPEPDQLMITVTEPSVVSVPDANVFVSFRIVPAQPDLAIQVPELNRVFFDADLVPFPLVLRNFRPGDRFSPWGMVGTRKVKNIFIDAKTPLRVRRVWPLLVKGNDILWIPGVRRSAAAPVGPDTARVLEVAIAETHDESD